MHNRQHQTRVLVAEDNPQLCFLFTKVLQAAGHHVASVSHGSAVLPAIEAHRPDVLVLDIGLPGTDGTVILDQIRGGDGRGLYVILVTGNLIDQHAPVMKLVDRYLMKPVFLDDLKQAVLSYHGSGTREGTRQANP